MTIEKKSPLLRGSRFRLKISDRLRSFLLLLAATLQSGTETQCHGRTHDRHRFGNVFGRCGDSHAATRSAISVKAIAINALVANAEVAQTETGNRIGEVQRCGEVTARSRKNTTAAPALAVITISEADIEIAKLVG